MCYSAFRSAAALVLLAGLAACSSSEKEDPTPAHAVSWQVDGSMVTATSYTTSPQSTGSLVTVTGQLNVGSSAASSQVMLDVPRAVGAYTISPTASVSATYISSANNASQVYHAGANPVSGTVTGAGSIVVTEVTASSISGTFTFTGIDKNTGATKSVSNGRFFVGL